MLRKPHPLKATLRRAIAPALFVAVLTFFGAYAFLGPNGVLALGDYRRQIVQRERVYATLDQRRAMLKNRVALLDPRHANPDMVDELVRKELNVAHPDEVIVPLQ
ncbi:FtsB family cell division protein [Sphingomonas adhaesiva]|uniref:FtsB family cell division protein n=1 Tax=Sphingomonas adhaesiva TaxID=28212 RepID=UPI002FFAAE0D